MCHKPHFIIGFSLSLFCVHWCSRLDRSINADSKLWREIISSSYITGWPFPPPTTTTSPQRWHILTRSNHLFVPRFSLFWLSFILLCHAEKMKRENGKKVKPLKPTSFYFGDLNVIFQRKPLKCSRIAANKDKTQPLYRCFVLSSFWKRVRYCHSVKTEISTNPSKHKHVSLHIRLPIR